MKTLVTHIRPHLDDICAMWILKRFDPALKDARMEFIPTDKNGGARRDDENTVCIGVGRGRFDEHKGDLDDCSTTLVYKEIMRLETPEPVDQAALKKMVDWVFAVDTGRLKGAQWQQFSVPSVFDGYFETHDRDSLMLTEFGFELLDSLFAATRGEVGVSHDWAERFEFETPWGRGAAVVSDRRQVDGYAYERGYAVVAIMSSAGNYHTIRADANSDADLTAAYEEIRRREPEASWYFHHSKKMLICGGTGGTAAERPSRLTLRDLAALIRKT